MLEQQGCTLGFCPEQTFLDTPLKCKPAAPEPLDSMMCGGSEPQLQFRDHDVETVGLLWCPKSVLEADWPQHLLASLDWISLYSRVFTRQSIIAICAGS